MDDYSLEDSESVWNRTEAYQRWQSWQILVENCKFTVRECKDSVRKAKSHGDLQLAKDVKIHKKGFFVKTKHKQEENTHPLLSRSELVTNNSEKVEVLYVSFSPIFTNAVWTQVLGAAIQVDDSTGQESEREDLVCELSQELGALHKSMGPDNIHLRVLRLTLWGCSP